MSITRFEESQSILKNTYGFNNDEIEKFVKILSHDMQVSDIINLMPYQPCSKDEYNYFIGLLVKQLPYTINYITLDKFQDGRFYNESIYVKNHTYIFNPSYINGDFEINGKLIVNGKGFIQADTIKAKKINTGLAIIARMIEADSIILDGGLLVGNIKTKTIYLSKNSQIWGNIEAEEIINNGGIIDGDVNTIKIENINGSKVKRKTVYKGINKNNLKDKNVK